MSTSSPQCSRNLLMVVLLKFLTLSQDLYRMIKELDKLWESRRSDFLKRRKLYFFVFIESSVLFSL